MGAELQPGGGAHLRVWAPRRARVAAVIDGAAIALAREADGYFAGHLPGARAGTRYQLRLDHDERLYPDPASRYQPEGPHGPSQIVDPARFAWTDQGWRGVALPGQVIYELHAGTFTREGTWAAAARQLPALAELGVTVIELLPVAEFPGRFGWGYDGVDLFAPTRLYGEPDELRAFVDAAHGLGLGVILDVVYNHLGPDGNYLSAFSDHYTSQRYPGEWGDPINFDDEHAGPVRDFYVANAGYWIDEFHLDGLRIDATQGIFDASPEHVLVAIARRVREAARGRATLLIAENEPQDTDLVRSPDRGGTGLDALWNDDFHHTAMVALTGKNEAYFSDHTGAPQELLSAIKWGYLFQGQRYHWQKQRRGTPGLDLAPMQLVTYLQNHDQVPNVSAPGWRVHAQTTPGRLRALTALWLLAPGTPMLFQGQEWAASSPFFYFADHHAELAELVRAGRAEFVQQFPSTRAYAAAGCLPDPGAEETFARCKLDHDERARPGHAEALALHRDLLRLRRTDPVIRLQRGWPHLDGAVVGPEALMLRWFAGDRPGDSGDDRVLLVNLGRDLALTPAPEPLLAPPRGRRWATRWASEALEYGGCGAAPAESDEGVWLLAGHAAVLLHAVPREAT